MNEGHKVCQSLIHYFLIISTKDWRTVSTVWKSGLCCLFNLQISCCFPAHLFLLTSVGLFTVRKYFLMAKTGGRSPWRSTSFSKPDWHCKPPTCFCLTLTVKKQSLRKLVRIFDLAFPAEPTGGSKTCCLWWFLYLKRFASQPCLFKACWYLSDLVPALPFCLNALFFFSSVLTSLI